MRPAQVTETTIPRHYLRTGRIHRSVARLITLDTETMYTDHGGYQDHSLRCWVARLDVRDHDHAPISTAEYSYGVCHDELADQVDEWTRTSHTTWLYTHNLAFDATVSDLPLALVRRGWEITSSNIIDSPIWFRMRRGRRRLVLADSHGVWPCSLATIATDLGLAKTPLPHNDDADMDEWWQRCEVDVTILATALLTVLSYWDTHQLGRWSVTGSGSGWSVFKTNFITTRILIDIDSDAMEFEQRAVYGGRREAFRVGEFAAGTFVDLDFRAAYPSIVAGHDIPVRRIRHFTGYDGQEHRRRRRDRGVIAECTVRTTVPVVPVRYGESIFYPTGTFRTVLASPEIDLIEAHGGHVSIGAGYLYELGPGMATWGRWITGLLVDDTGAVPPLVRRMAKNWSRAVLGRWTMRLSRRVDLPGFPTTGKAVTRAEWIDYDPADVELVDGVSRRRAGAVPIRRVKGYQILYGGEYYALVADQWPENGFPAVWAWIESLCRSFLWQAMAAQPAGTVWQCDTDGYLVGMTARTAARRRAGTVGGNPAVRAAGDRAGSEITIPSVAGLQMVEKGRYGSCRILGPQHVVLGGTRRFPGVPRAAREVGPDEFTAQTWPGYLSQLEHGDPRIFRTGSRTLKVGAGLNPRWLLASGRTLPVEMCLDQAGRNDIAPPPAWSGGNPVRLADVQHSVLSRVRHS